MSSRTIRVDGEVKAELDDRREWRTERNYNGAIQRALDSGEGPSRRSGASAGSSRDATPRAEAPSSPGFTIVLIDSADPESGDFLYVETFEDATAMSGWALPDSWARRVVRAARSLEEREANTVPSGARAE